MATIKQALPQPEAGWKRYDDTDINITYENFIHDQPDGLYYNNTVHRTQNAKDIQIKFNFKGSKIRLIGRSARNRANMQINIDNDKIIEYFNQNSSTIVEMSLDYEKTGLSYGLHNVVITGLDNLDFYLDAIDIDENGELLPYKEAITYSLIKYNNKILTLSENNELVDTELVEPLTKQDFIAHGINKLSNIPKEKLSELNSFEILTWTDSPYVPQLELTIPETKPYKLLDNPSIVTYTEDEEVPVLSQTVIAESKIRFLVSKDKTNYQVYRDNNWITIDKSNILEQGMTKTELESIPQEVWAEWFENEAHKHNFDILVSMYSESPNKPLIRSITVNYAENEAPIVIGAHIEPDTIHNEFATIKANVKDYEGDKISFKVLIKKAGISEFVQASPVEGWYNRATSEEEITQAFNFPYFNPGENDIKLVVKDERGVESEWLGKIILSNTDPIISLTYDDFSMTATIGDDEDDSIAYKLSINDEEIFDYTNFVPTKAHVGHVFDTKKLKFGEENTVTLEVKDTHGGYAKQEFVIIGSYRGLMFKNEDNQYFIDDKGNILMDLLFDETLIGGQTSKTKKVTLENRHEFPISNVEVITQKPIKTKNENGEEVIEIVDGDDFAEGATLELSETEMPFNPKNIIKILETMPVQGTKDFYVRVKTNRDAHQGGYFYIKSTASPVTK